MTIKTHTGIHELFRNQIHDQSISFFYINLRSFFKLSLNTKVFIFWNSKYVIIIIYNTPTNIMYF